MGSHRDRQVDVPFAESKSDPPTWRSIPGTAAIQLAVVQSSRWVIGPAIDSRTLRSEVSEELMAACPCSNCLNVIISSVPGKQSNTRVCSPGQCRRALDRANLITLVSRSKRSDSLIGVAKAAVNARICCSCAAQFPPFAIRLAVSNCSIRNPSTFPTAFPTIP